MTVKQEGQKCQQYFSAMIASIGALQIGCALAWTSPSLPLLKSPDFATPFKITSVDEVAQISAWTPIGAILGALATGIFTGWMGRKTIFIVFSIPWICTWILTNMANSVVVLYMARFFNGLMLGLFSAVLPAYVSEIAEDSIRGILGTQFQIFLTLGILLDYVLGLFNSYSLLNNCITAVSVCFFVLLIFIPESPTYLMMKNRRSDAEKSLKRLRGSQYNVDVELNDLQTQLENASKHSFSIGLLFQRVNFLALVICIGVMLAQQLSGINAVIFFAQNIFQESGAKDPVMCSIIMGIVQSTATVASSFLVERAGRKILLLISSTSMGLCLVALGYYFWLRENEHDVSNLGWLPLTTIVGFIITFSLGLGPIPWMMSGEVLSPELKSIGTGISATVNYTCVAIVTYCFEPFVHWIGTAYTFWIFAVICGLSTAFFLVVLPETKGRSIHEVQNMLAGKKPTSNTMK